MSQKSNKSLNIFALGPNVRNRTPSNVNESPFMKYERLLSRKEKGLIIGLIVLLLLGVIFFLHWKDIINIPFLPESTKQHPKK